MAYIKHLWSDRQGTGLTRFTDIISGDTLELTPAPTTITQEGTPLSAAWLNEMEAGIGDAQVLVGDSAPTTATAGAVGQLYLCGNAVYRCSAAAAGSYTWVQLLPGSISAGTADPTGGQDGDIYLKYEA